MNRDDLRAFCLELPAATSDFPFGPETEVFRVGGKLFALLPTTGATVNLKCDPERALELRRRYTGVAPGWHQNKRHWNTVTTDGDVPVDEVTAMVEDSYDLVFSSLPKRERDAIDIRAARSRG